MPLGFGKSVLARSAPAGGGGEVGGAAFITNVFMSQTDTATTTGNDAIFDDVKFNTNSFITVGAGSDDFTITETGKYYINATQSFSPTAGSLDQYVAVQVKKNGTQICRGQAMSETLNANTILRPMAQGYFDLTAGDSITVDTFKTYSTANVTTTNNLYSNLVILQLADNDEIQLTRTTVQNILTPNTFSGGTADGRYYREFDLEWNSQTVIDTGFTHSTGSNTNEITLADPGTYFISSNLAIDIAGLPGATRGCSVAFVECTDENYGGDNDSSYKRVGISHGNWLRYSSTMGPHDHNLFGFITTTAANAKVRVRIATEAMGDSNRMFDLVVQTSSFCKIIKTESSDLFIGVNDNADIQSTIPGSATARSLEFDDEIVKNASLYTHSTVTNPNEVTLATGNRYIVMGSDFHRIGKETGDSNDANHKFLYTIRDLTNSVDLETNLSGPHVRTASLIAGSFAYQDDDLGNEDGTDAGLASRGQDGSEITAHAWLSVVDCTGGAKTIEANLRLESQTAADGTTSGVTAPSDDSNYNVKNLTGSTVNGVANNDYGFGTYAQDRSLMIIKV